MRTIYFFLVLFFSFIQSFTAQIGINTTDPDAVLEILASNPADPANTDGILIPRLDAFPTISPTADQNGMLIFHNPDNIFYFWDDSNDTWTGLVDILHAVNKINDLTDAKSDNDGSENGSSIFLGINAGMGDDSSDNRNIGIGLDALKMNTIGFRNIAIGRQALTSNVSGGHNTAIGYHVLSDNTVGERNTGIGYQALKLNTLGNYNTALGHNANFNNQEGSNNTIIGYQAGMNSSPHNKSGNVFLGYQAGYHEDGNNKLYIENSLSPDPLIYGEFDNDLLKVNGKLEVKGEIVLEDSNTPTPVAGTIRWNQSTQDFEGYTGSEWNSLTYKVETWGYGHTENQKVISSDLQSADNFGYSVAISGDYAIIGAPYKTYWNPPITPVPIDNQGVAYIFHRSNNIWSEQAILFPSDGMIWDCFSSSVAISGDYAFIGSRNLEDVNPQPGKVYIFHRSGTTWTEESTLSASDGVVGDGFGCSISISEDDLVVGADGADKVYTYLRASTTWTEQAILIPSYNPEESFGASVSISGDHVVVGAPSSDGFEVNDVGRAVVFLRVGSTWSEEDVISASDGAAADYFGRTVAISGDNIAVGAQHHDTGGNSNMGKAYIFHRSGTVWSQTSWLTPIDGAAGDFFGNVSISGNSVIVGSQHHDTYGNNSQGKSYIFQRNGSQWLEEDNLIASDGTSFDKFGFCVSLSEETAIVGTLNNSAYFFNK